MIRDTICFDNLAYSDLANAYNSSTGGSIQTGGPQGQNYLRLPDFSSNAGLGCFYDSQSTWVVGFRFRTANTAPVFLLFKNSSGTTVASLTLNADGSLTFLGTNSAPKYMLLNQWYYVEVKLTVASSITAGSCKVRVNGQDWITVATGTNTSANGNATQIWFNSGRNNGFAFNTDFCDIAIMDGQTSDGYYDFQGDCRVYSLLPSSDGDRVEWTIGGNTPAATTYQSVNESTPNGDTTYVSSGTAGQVFLSKLPSLSASVSQVLAVQQKLYLKNDAAGTRIVVPHIKSGTTESDAPVSAQISPTTSYLIYRYTWNTDPNTGTNWTPTAVNSLQVGAKLVS